MSTATKTPPASKYYPAQKITQIHPHPNNPRHDAHADDDLVASIRADGVVQPLIVVPRTEGKGYHLVAGHRRMDACQQLGMDTVPVVVRTDIVGNDQVLAAMLVENGRRRDLTPVEEAEGYEQLGLFGLDQAQIADRVGVSRTTVASRVKLMKLPEPTRQRIHEGQVTLDEALSMVRHTGNKKNLTRLAEAAGTPNFRQVEAAVKRETEDAARDVETRKQMKSSGVKEYRIPDGMQWWTVIYDPDMPSPVIRTGVDASMDDLDAAKAAHDGCLRWVIRSAGMPAELWCADPAKHADDQYTQESGDQAERRRQADEAAAERERHREEAAAARAAQDDASKLRVESLMSWARNRGRHNLVDVRRLASTVVVVQLLGNELFLDDPEPYFKALGEEGFTKGDIDDDDTASFGWADRTLTGETDPAVALAAMLTAVEDWLKEPYLSRWTPNARAILAYLDLLDHVGHPFSDVDVTLRDELQEIVDTAIANTPPVVEDVDVKGGVL